MGSLSQWTRKHVVRKDNEMHSYLEIADAIRQMSASPKEDLEALWRRIAFNVLISNVDDHLRNHAFLYSGLSGWRLSPAYDLNPTPTDMKPRILSTAIDLIDPTASLDVAVSLAHYFDLNNTQAKKIFKEVGLATALWREEATKQQKSIGWPLLLSTRIFKRHWNNVRLKWTKTSDLVQYIRNIVQIQARPWHKKQDSTKPVGPGEVKRLFATRIFPVLGSPGCPPTKREKSRGRELGTRFPKRERKKVVKKRRKQRQAA